MSEAQRLLFVCSRNQWRSPTAESVWSREPGVNVRSAGTSPSARRTVSEADIRWADRIFVMESSHRDQLRRRFAELMAETPCHVLGIPDDYEYMDPELVEMLRDGVRAILDTTDAD